MNSKLYVSAFSIMEVIISMVITAIVMGIIFIIFSIVTERMLDYKGQNQYIADLNRMTYSINKDIFESQSMMISDNGLVFSGYSGNTVRLLLRDDYTLHSMETFVDTFRIQIRQMKIDTIRSANKKTVFQKLRMNIVADDKEINLDFFRRVYADELLKKHLKNEF